MLAKRRWEVGQMNLTGMTLVQIGEKLGVNSATVCLDLEWIREEWRKAAVANYVKARSVELAKLNLVEKYLWKAWQRSTEEKGTRIEVRIAPDGEYEVRRCAADDDAERRAAVENHDTECRATVGNHDAERRATLADHDAEDNVIYLCDKRENQVGRPAFLEGALTCVGRRVKLFEADRGKEERTGVEENCSVTVAAHGLSFRVGCTENAAALHTMRCVIGAERVACLRPAKPRAGTLQNEKTCRRARQCGTTLRERELRRGASHPIAGVPPLAGEPPRKHSRSSRTFGGANGSRRQRQPSAV